MTEKIKFPFEPSEKVKAAFRNEGKTRVAIEIITRALVEAAASQVESPWMTLRKEHPEFQHRLGHDLVWNGMSETLDIKTRD